MLLDSGNSLKSPMHHLIPLLKGDLKGKWGEKKQCCAIFFGSIWWIKKT